MSATLWELKGLDLLKHFGFPTSIAEIKPSALREKNRGGHIDWLALSDEDTRSLNMELMEDYTWLFEKGVNCEWCSTPGDPKPIILPIDLRREAATHYHGYCYEQRIQEELKRLSATSGSQLPPNLHHSLPTNRFELETILKIARVCTPAFDPPGEGLTISEIADVKGITTREQLEKWYWTGSR